MPFMRGKEPIRRTIKYLESGKIVLKDQIKIFSLNYNTFGPEHKGARDFAFWNLSQVQYKNPNVQVISFKNMTPTPFVKCFYEDGKQILIDLDSQNRDDIEKHLMNVIGKPKQVLQAEAKLAAKQDNPSTIGVGCERHCICEIPGQVPCPGIVQLPNIMRGKFAQKSN